MTCAKNRKIINNSAGDCSISLKHTRQTVCLGNIPIPIVESLPTTEPPKYHVKPSCFSYWQLLQLQEVVEVDSWTHRQQCRLMSLDIWCITVDSEPNEAAYRILANPV